MSAAPEETEDLLLHPDSRASAEQLLERGALTGGLIVAGPQGIGKASLAFALAATILSGRDQIGDEDRAVRHLIASGAHPDLVVVHRQPHEKTGKLRQEIGVDQIREANRRLQQVSTTGRRAVIVDLADDLGTAAGNAFLKNLEEPPAGTAIFLLSNSPSQLLPTLTSRCRKLVLKPVPTDMLGEWLGRHAGLGSKEAAEIADAADGRPGKALQLADADMGEAARLADSFLKAVAGKSDLLNAARKFAAKDAELQAEEARELILTRLRKALTANGLDLTERGRRLLAYEEARRTFRQAGTADVTQTALIAGMRIRDAMGMKHVR
jgi:DNA polymerase-3 subunit delta'